MTIDPISIVERAIRETEKRVEREIAEWLRGQVDGDGPLSSTVDGIIASHVERMADDIESGAYKK